MGNKRNTALQAICRDYLGRLKNLASKHGLAKWVEDTIKANAREECSATEDEVEALGRMVDEERVSRVDIPKILGNSYRECNENEDFDKIKKLRHVGIYSKISTLLYKSEQNG